MKIADLATRYYVNNGVPGFHQRMQELEAEHARVSALAKWITDHGVCSLCCLPVADADALMRFPHPGLVPLPWESSGKAAMNSSCQVSSASTRIRVWRKMVSSMPVR